MKTVIEMARDCGINFHQAGWPELERFAELVREDEREEIAEFIEKTNLGSLPEETAMHYALLLKSYANAIRARSNT